MADLEENWLPIDRFAGGGRCITIVHVQLLDRPQTRGLYPYLYDVHYTGACFILRSTVSIIAAI